MKKRFGWQLILSWALAAFFVVAGGLNVTAPGSVARDYERWGYPDWFHYATGAFELVSAVLLAWPARRKAGAALGMLVMAAAIVTLIVSREWAHAVIPFTAMLALAATFAPITPRIPDAGGTRANGEELLHALPNQKPRHTMSVFHQEPKGVVVYHSGYGHTKRMAEAVANGAQARLLPIDADGKVPEETWTAIDESGFVILGSPTYMGGPSWQFKKFADASSKPWFADRRKDKVFGGFTNSASINGDKLSTLQYFTLLAAQHRGIWVGVGMRSSNTKASQRDDLNRMGAFIGPMAQTPADASPEEMSAGDLETARRYGVRVAEIAGSLFRGTVQQP